MATSVNDALKAPDLPLVKIKTTLGLAGARAVIVLALTELVSFFNVSNTMNAEQVALTTDLILESYWYFKLEDIKCCFRRAMRSGQVFGRLDGNVIFQWLREYDLERDQQIEENEIALNNSFKSNTITTPISPDAVSFEQYIEDLKARVANGDKDAEEALETASRMRIGTRGWDDKKEKDFQEYYKQYRISKLTKK